MSGDEKKAEKAIKEYLQDYWKNKKCIDKTTDYEQISLFDHEEKNE